MKDLGNDSRIGFAAEAHLDDLAIALSQAFQDDPLFVHVIPNSEERRKFLPLLCRADLKMGVDYGRVYAELNRLSGASIWFSSDAAYLSLDQYEESDYPALESQLPNGAYDRFITAVDFMELQHKKILSEPHWYLMVVGIEPTAQGQGLGDTLVARGLKEAATRQMPIYLETFTAKNVEYYENRGFNVIRECIEPSSKLTCWAMVRSVDAT